MKKIVALVLSLVMVLGLATTAFAATPANYYAANDLTTALGTDTAVTYSLEKYTTGSEQAKLFDTVAIWSTNKLNGAKTLVDTYVVAASADSADYAFVDGTSITYLNSTATTWATEVTAVPTVDFEDVANCGEIYVGNDAALYTDANATLYVEDAAYAATATAGVVGGKYVALKPLSRLFATVALDDCGAVNAGAVVIVAHDYDVDYKTYNSDTTVTRVFCTECKAEFAFVEGTEAMAIQKFGAGNYNNLGNGLYVSKTAGTAAVAPEAGDKVESAETFDAGIAMYVGMSVMAAAGSAVVLKKKD